MELRFGRDFSGIKVHTDARAAASASAIGALAYAAGGHVVFAPGRYDPASTPGRRLLAHELTHVVQQRSVPAPQDLTLAPASSADEAEADRVAAGATPAAAVRPRRAPAIARFSDTGHHVVEEAALPGAGFSAEQIAGIERGNVQRDYSQVGVVGNALLLCRARSFGGYRPQEHFDNFVWDAVTRGWRTRGGSALREQGVDAGPTPIDYIRSQLDSVAGRGLADDAGLAHLGNAFHTVEDFFAHSNFVELIQGDRRHGTTLMTGNPAGPSQSVPRTLEAITPLGVREGYRARAEQAIRSALPGTHTAMAHDDPTAHNYTAARRLAALVIQDLGTEVMAVMAAAEPQRARLMAEQVGSKVARYLRPPDPSDRWWESLLASDAGRIDRRLDEAARRTPVTVNQCALSPLKNLEASQDSAMAIPFGVAMPTTIQGNQVWFQVGAGVTRQAPLEPIGRGTEQSQGTPFIGAQITGRF